MAEQNERGSSVADAVGKAATAAKSAATAIKAAGKAATGDVAGAVMDVLRDPALMKAIVATILIVSFLVVFVFLAVGAIIVQIVQMVVDEWTENMESILTEDAIASGGNKLSLITKVSGAGYEATWQTLYRFFTGEDKHKDGTDFGREDYQTTVDSVIDKEAFAGVDGALWKRIELIKTRVDQRKSQLATTLTDYAWDAMGLTLALDICEKGNNFFLYNGVSGVNTTIDVSCFALSDIQCIKILAAYCAQWECDIQSVDIWGLMNYLGWYDSENGSAAMQDSVNSGTIYDTSRISRFTEEFYGAYSAGTVVGNGATSSIELNPPEIPIWKGSFMPQYLLEEMKILTQMEKDGQITLPKDITGATDWAECCPSYEYDGGYGIIDYLFTGSAFVSFSRTDYTGLDSSIDEFLAALVDKNLSQIADWWKGLWDEEETSKPTSLIVKKQGINQKTTVTQTIYADGSPSTYSVVTAPSVYVFSPNKIVITQAGTDVYTQMVADSTVGGVGVGGNNFTAKDLLPNTEYSIYIQMPDDAAGKPVYHWVDTFTTAFETEDGEIYQAYQIQIDIDVTYRARSIDELAFDIIGLWPGELTEVEYNANGSLRAAGHGDNSLLKLNWKDVILDASGNTHSIEFTRVKGNQYEYYLDYVKGIADTLKIDTTGVFTPEFNYGDNLVSIAGKEYDYYVHNSEKGGYRYWEICSAVTGKDYQKEARSGQDWSTVFLLSCAYQCGYLGDNNCFGGFGCNAATWPITCTELYNGLREYSSATRHEAANYTPSPGDLVFFSSMGAGSRTPDQVGIVVAAHNGKLYTIEGGSNDAVEKCTYASYKVGSVAYTDAQGPMYISSYISPNYPDTFAAGKQYLKNHTLVNSSKQDATQIHIGGAPTTTILVGAGRFRLSQLPDVLAVLEKDYAYLLNEEYPALVQAVNTAVAHYENGALTTAEISNVVTCWYYFDISCGNQLGTALTEIAARNYVSPVLERIKKDTGFDWNKTAVRREILWQVVTSTDQHHIARQTLLELVEGKDNKLTDDELLTLLMAAATKTAEDGTVTTLSISYMRSVLEEQQGGLWPEDHTRLRREWIVCAEKNLNAIREKYVNGTLT